MSRRRLTIARAAAAVAVLLAVSGCHKKPAETQTAVQPAPPVLPTDVTAPPPASQFREGDRWRAWGFDASGRPTNTFRTFYVHNGAWDVLQGGIDSSGGPRDARSFQQLKDPVFYPAGAAEDDFFATIDGTLHRYVHGQWTDLPIGATLTDQRGTVYKVDVRASAYDADQIQEAFGLTKPTFRAVGENRELPVLLPTRDQLADAGEAAASPSPSAATPPVTPPTPPASVTPPPMPPPSSPPPAASKPLFSGLSLRVVLLVVLLGGIGALLLRNLRGGH